jgi:hypothetical protein
MVSDDGDDWKTCGRGVTRKMEEEIEVYHNRIFALGSGLPAGFISIRAGLALRFSRASKAAIERSGLTV